MGMLVSVLCLGLGLGYLSGRKSPKAIELKPAPLPSDWSKGVLTLYGFDRDGKAIAHGCGNLADATGTVVTNWHVLEEAASAEAHLEDGRIYQVVLVKGGSTKKDLLILKLGRDIKSQIQWPDHLPFLVIGNSSTLTLGARIVTIGSPEGLNNSVSEGVVSSIREGDFGRLIQITSPISPGSSGGPVLNVDGQVVGVV